MKTITRVLFVLLALVTVESCTKTEVEEKPVTIIRTDPAQGQVDQSIIIVGTNFNSLQDSSGSITVFFHDKQTTGNITSDSTIEVIIPFEAGDGPICIQTGLGKICSSQSFDYLPGNPTSNSYMRLADCPNTPTNQVSALVATDNAILAGFINWWKYDIDKNTWTTMVGPTDKIVKAACFTYNGKAYLFGGNVMGGQFSNRLQCFDPATDSWSFKAPMPSTPRAESVSFVSNNKVYIAGGTDTYNLGFNSVYNQLWEYDPVADSWIRKADLPLGTGYGGYALRIGTKFYIPGGSYGGQEYDPQTNTWNHFYPDDLPADAVPYSDKDFALGYVLMQSGYVDRYAIDFTGNHFFRQDYGHPPAGYTAMILTFSAVVNNQLYYGLGHVNNGSGYIQTNQFWRYRY